MGLNMKNRWYIFLRPPAAPFHTFSHVIKAIQKGTFLFESLYQYILYIIYYINIYYINIIFLGSMQGQNF